MSNYLTSKRENIPIETVQFIAKLQTHMVETVKPNFHAFYRPNFIRNSCFMMECMSEYEDIIDDNDPVEQSLIAHIMMANLKQKKELKSVW